MEESKEHIASVASTALAVREAGIGNHLLERLQSDPAYRERVGAVMRDGGVAEPVVLDKAHRRYYCHGLAVFGPLEWERLFRVKIQPEQWQAAAKFPWQNIATLALESCPFWPGQPLAQTHFAFFAPELLHLEPYASVELDVDSIYSTLRLYLAHWTGMPPLTVPEDPAPLSPIASTRWHLMPLLPVAWIDSAVTAESYIRMTVAEYLLGLILYYQKYSRWPQIGETTLEGRAAICEASPGSVEEPWCVYLDPHNGGKLNYCRESRLPTGIRKFEAMGRRLPPEND
jgi:hypothetical protein